MLSRMTVGAPRARAYTVPTDAPEADGTFRWTSTTLVVVEVEAGGCLGLGYTYGSAAIVPLITTKLSEVTAGTDATDPPAAWRAMQRAVRNMGRNGIAATAISAVDVALWDLKAKLLDVPLALLLGRFRDTVPIYGSGGFTSYNDDQLRDQLAGWVQRDGCGAVKIKIGTHPSDDPRRAAVARAAIGAAPELFVDANGAFAPRQAIALGERLAAESGVTWFEEPVSSDDLAGLAVVRGRAPSGMDIAAGEYLFTANGARLMLEAGAVDVLQADATRCGGVTGFSQIAALCEAHHRDLSGHCAPALHLHLACAAPRLRHLEWFHDHVRIESLLFDGAPVPHDGAIAPDLTRPGLGLVFKHQDAEQYAA